jgi:hypothetical protein
VKKKTSSKSIPADSSLSATWQKRFSIANSNQSRLFRQFADWYDVFNAKIDPRVSNWRSKPFMPIVAQQVWALVAKFSAMRPGFEVRVRDGSLNDEELEQKASMAEKKLEYDYDCPLMDEPMREKLSSVLIDTCVTGTGIARVPWRSKTNTRYERVVNEDTGIADLTKEKKFEKQVGYNDLEPVNIFNVFVSPATDKLHKGWLIIRDYIPVSELKDTNEAKGGAFYNNLDKLSGTPSYGDYATLNNSRNRFMSDQEPADATTDIATIYECYEGDNIYIFGDDKDAAGEGGWVLLRKTKNYYWHGKWPIVKFHIKKRPFSFWGQGLAELTYRLQVIYNDLFAHFLDAENLINNPSFWVSEDSDVDDFIVEPGSLNYYNGQKPPEPIVFNKPDANGLQMIIDMINQSIEGVTASSYATGLPNSSSDKTHGTATGILKLQDAAGDIVGYMRENFTTSLVQVGKMWHSNNQQFMQAPINITVSDKGKRTPVEVSPSDLQGEADIYIDTASMNPKSDEDKLNAAMARKATLLEVQQASFVQQQAVGTDPLIINFQELVEDVGEALDYQNTEQLLLSQDQVNQMLEEKGMQMGQDHMNEQMGLPTDPNAATQQTAAELLQSGHIDPTQLQSLDQKEGEQGGS